MLQTINFSGQEIKYIHENHTVLTTIREPFWTAGQDLDWPGEHHNHPGLGFNMQIMQFVLTYKATLCVKVLSVEDAPYYYIKIDKLKQFLNLVNDTPKHSEKMKNGVNLKVIDWKLFKRDHRSPLEI